MLPACTWLQARTALAQKSAICSLGLWLELQPFGYVEHRAKTERACTSSRLSCAPVPANTRTVAWRLPLALFRPPLPWPLRCSCSAAVSPR